MSSQLEQLIAQVDDRKEELVELISSLIRFQTPAPPARNTREAQAFISDYLADLSFTIDQWDVYPDDPNLVAVKKGEASKDYRSLIINGHIDVAEVREDEDWISNPFEPIIRDGKIIGRGAADMKGGLACALFAFKLLQEAKLSLKGDLIFQSVIGEEVGEAGTLQCIERGYTADFALVADTSNLHIQGQGGVITGWITVKSPKIHHDAMRRNMVHAGGGMLAASAIEKMMPLIEGLQVLEKHWAITKSYEGFPPGTNTINPAVIEGGRHPAFIADECKLWITVHYYPNETFEDVSKEIEAHLLAIAEADPWLRENKPTFEWGGRSMIEEKGEIFPALEVDQAHPAVQMLARAHQSVHQAEPVFDMSPSVTDGGWFGHAKIPAAIYGPGEFSQAHAVNESCSIEQFLQYTKTLIHFIYEWTNQPKHG